MCYNFHIRHEEQALRHLDSLNYEFQENTNAKLYEFLVTNYDISDLANKIYAAKYLKLNTLNLKKGSAEIA